MFGRSKPKDEVGVALAAGIVNSENSRPQSSQDALEQALGINPYLLYDEDTLKLIRSLAFVPQRDPKTGQITGYDVNAKFVALAIQASYTARASKYEAIDAEIMLRRASRILRNITMSMNDDEYETGAADIIESVYNGIIVPNILSGVGGFMAKLTKVSPKSMEVTYREDKSKHPKESFSP